LHLSVRARLRVEPLGRNGVHLVDEDDGGRVVACKSEHIAHHPRPLSQILLHELRPVHPDEVGFGHGGNSARDHRLARARRPVQQNSSGRVYTDLLIEVKVRQRQLHRLSDLLLLLVAATNVGVRHIGLRCSVRRA
jgi:hypothetical protein